MFLLNTNIYPFIPTNILPIMANKYSSIWNKLKSDSHCAISAPVQLQPRIIKAVIRCKDEDYSFKLTNKESRKWVKLHYLREAGRVRFFLVAHSVLTNITIEEL